MSTASSPSGIVVRAARGDDIPQIAAIYADAVLNGTATYELEPPTESEMASRFEALEKDGFPYLAAQSGEAVLGYAYAGPFRPRPAYRFLVEDSIYISPAARGHGLGALLLTRLIEEATALGFRQMIAVIGDGHLDSPSVRLHRKLGFADSGRLVGSGYKHDRWLDTIFMQLAMNGGDTAPPDPCSLPERKFRGEA